MIAAKIGENSNVEINTSQPVLIEGMTGGLQDSKFRPAVSGPSHELS